MQCSAGTRVYIIIWRPFSVFVPDFVSALVLDSVSRFQCYPVALKPKTLSVVVLVHF
jgi:hypothetical protein